MTGLALLSKTPKSLFQRVSGRAASSRAYGAIKVHYGYKLSDGWSRIYSAILYKNNDSTKGYAHYDRKNEYKQYTFNHDNFIIDSLEPGLYDIRLQVTSTPPPPPIEEREFHVFEGETLYVDKHVAHGGGLKP